MLKQARFATILEVLALQSEFSSRNSVVTDAHQYRYVRTAVSRIKDYVSQHGEAGTFELN
jgi:hypothetical protein